MVRISANGDIVPQADAEPRISQSNISRQRRQASLLADNQLDAQVHAVQPRRSIFSSLNSQLSALGIPTFHIGPYPVEPLTSVGFLISLLMFGFSGLLFSGFLFFVVNYSQMGWGDGGRGGPGGRTWRSWLGFGSGSPVSSLNRRGEPQRRRRDTMMGGPSNWSGTGHRLGSTNDT